MKISLNLLPKSRKKKIKNWKILKLFIWQEGMLILVVILLFGGSVGIKEIIDIRMKSINTQLPIDSAKGNYTEIKEYEEALEKTRTDIIIIDKIQKNNINWIPIFEKINKNIPEGIRISSISNDEFKVVILGMAENRDQLIKMKSQMEKDDCFREISIPINDIVSRNDIDFKVDFKVNKNCLIKYE